MKPKKAEKKPLSDEEKLVLAQKRAEAKKAAVNDVLERFGSLPDEAHVRMNVVKYLYGCSAATIWRNVKKGIVPTPHKFGSRVTAWNVGELRTALSA